MKASRWLSGMVVLLAAGLLVMVLQRPERPGTEGVDRPRTGDESVATGPATVPGSTAEGLDGGGTGDGTPPAPAPADGGVGEFPRPGAMLLEPDDQAEIDGLIGDQSLADGEVAARLADLALDPARDPGLRLEAMGHAVNLLPPENLNRLRPLLEQEGTPDELAQALMFEAINSPDPVVTMEMSIAALEGPNAVAREEAVELVTFLLNLQQEDGTPPPRDQLIAAARTEIERLRAEEVEAVESVNR